MKWYKFFFPATVLLMVGGIWWLGLGINPLGVGGALVSTSVVCFFAGVVTNIFNV